MALTLHNIDIEDKPKRAWVPNPKGNPGWRKGVSGNPKGAQLASGRESLTELCRGRTAEAVGVLIRLMHHKGPHQFAAAVAILDRAWGKPTQHIETTGNSTLELHLIAARAVSQAMIDGVIEAEIMDDKPSFEARDINETPSE